MNKNNKKIDNPNENNYSNHIIKNDKISINGATQKIKENNINPINHLKTKNNEIILIERKTTNVLDLYKSNTEAIQWKQHTKKSPLKGDSLIENENAEKNLSINIRKNRENILSFNPNILSNSEQGLNKELNVNFEEEKKMNILEKKGADKRRKNKNFEIDKNSNIELIYGNNDLDKDEEIIRLKILKENLTENNSDYKGLSIESYEKKDEIKNDLFAKGRFNIKNRNKNRFNELVGNKKNIRKNENYDKGDKRYNEEFILTGIEDEGEEKHKNPNTESPIKKKNNSIIID